jgi:hypothetical protein
MNKDAQPSSFDALAHEHNLSPRMRDLCRIFWKAAMAIGREQQRKLDLASTYNHVTDRDTVPGEFR